MMLSRLARGGALAGALALLVLAGAGPSCAAEPILPRSHFLTVDEVRPGMKGVGKSVFRGTRVETFGITVIGVLRRIDFDGDIILVRIDSGPPVSRGYGVISGMSGSPIYLNGKLIGALAYAWPFAKQPIAGITPIAQMLEDYQPGSALVRTEGSLQAVEPFLIDGERIERAVVAPSHPNAAGLAPNTAALVPVATPVMVSGLGPGTMPLLRAALEPLGLVPLAGGGAMGNVKTRIVPGQAVGARLVGGDLDVAAIGTVTYVKDDLVLAFGHRLSGLGATDLPLVAAYIHGVMPSAELSFKLASSGQSLGRFTEDRPWCVGGRLGDPAELIETGLEIADRDRDVTRRYDVRIIRSRLLTSALLTTVLAGAIRSVGPPTEGTTRVRFSLDAEGLPHMERENTYAVEDRFGALSLLLGPAGAAGSATEELSQILDVLQNSAFGEARLRRLSLAVELSKRRRVARVERVHVPTATVRPGDEVPVLITLRAANGGRITRVENVRIPPTCPPGRVGLGIAGGRSAEALRARLTISEPRPDSMAQMVAQMLERPSNNDLVLDLALPTAGIEARGFIFRDLPPAAIDLLRSAAATRLRPLRDYVESRTSTDWVISGSAVLSLVVEGDEEDKAGRPPSPDYRSPMYEEVRPGLADLFASLGMQASLRGLAEESGVGEGEIDVDAPAPMPTWEEVERVGEMDITVPSPTGEEGPAAPPRGDAIGRLASIWRLSTHKELSKGEAEGIAVLSTGGLALAPQPTLLARVEHRCLWPIAAAPDGSIYTGSWADGRLRRTAPDGDTTVVLETEDAAIQAIAVGPDASVYAAAVPSGIIHRISPGREPEEFCRLDAQNVWALAVADSGVVWAATGREGKLYRISPDGDPDVAFTAADRHITALALAPDQTVYLATSPLGKVYAVDPDGAARSLCELQKAAAQSIGVDAEGNVYVGTSPEARVLRITPDGAVRELLKAKAKHTLALLVTRDGVVCAASGPKAKVYVIDPHERTAEIYDPKTTFVAAMTADASGDIYLTAADTGRIIKLDRTSAATGRYLSSPRDAGATAHWGAVRWRGHAPPGTQVEIFTRSGHTAHPDDTWSPWQQVAARFGAAVPSPPARFLQCRVDLEGSASAAPRVDAVEIAYLPANRPPQVTITSPKGDEIWSGEKTITWSAKDPDDDKLTYQIYWSADRGQTWTNLEPAGEAATQESPREGEEDSEQQAGEGPASARSPRAGASASVSGPRRAAAPPLLPPAVSAAAFLPDTDESADETDLGEAAEDTGEAPIAASPDEEKPVPEPPSPGPSVSTTSRKWNTAALPDGIHWIKVVATDRRSNPTDPRQAEAVSRPFLIDNTPPDLILDLRRSDDAPPPGEVTAFDEATYVTSAEFRVDQGDWLAAVAKDGIFDGRFEAITLDEARLPDGAHEIEVRARDAAGNLASETLRYRR